MRVVIIGGGGAGATLAAQLDGAAGGAIDVVLIDTKTFYEYTPSVLHAFAIPDDSRSRARWDHIVQPHKTLVQHGRIVLGRVVCITLDNTVVTDSGERITFDVLCICSGSSRVDDLWRVPINLTTRQDRWEHLNYHRKALASAKRVLVIGGGPVGVELTGELCAYYPRTQVTLVQNAQELLPRVAIPRMRKKALAILRNYPNCEVLTGQRVIGTDTRFTCEPSGRVIEADVVFNCTGYQPNSDFMRQWYSQHLTTTGYIKVTAALHLDGLPHIFALGDVNDFPQEKLLSAAVRQADHVGRYLLRHHLNTRHPSDTTPAAYPGTLDCQVISLGPTTGVWYLVKLVVLGRANGSLLTNPFKYFNEIRMLYFYMGHGWMSAIHRVVSRWIDYVLTNPVHLST